jgi:hypothetical protein
MVSHTSGSKYVCNGSKFNADEASGDLHIVAQEMTQIATR